MRIVHSARGFTLIHLLIVFLVVVLAAAAGYRLWYEAQDEDSNLRASITSFEECVAAGNPVMESHPRQCAADGYTFTEAINEPVDETADWLKYTAPSGQTIRIADGLTLTNSDDTVLFTHEPEYKPGEKATTSTPLAGGSDNPIGLFINFQTPEIEYVSRGTKETLTTKSGLEVQKYTFTQTVDPDAIDIPKGATEIEYIAEKNGKHFRLTYAYTEDGNMREQVEQMVSTLEIN